MCVYVLSDHKPVGQYTVYIIGLKELDTELFWMADLAAMLWGKHRAQTRYKQISDLKPPFFEAWYRRF